MAIQYQIDGVMFYEAVVSGSVELIANKKQLNQINVFPVSDGDTGSNMSATVESVMNHMEKDRRLSVVINSAAEGALIGARGNSGIILAQFLYGVGLETKNCDVLELDRFVKVLKRSFNRLYELMTNPVEGTILTVIRCWITEMEAYTRHTNFTTYVTSIMTSSKAALEKTKGQLQVLQEHDVVDSGAKGFYSFLEGVHKYIMTGKVPELNLDKAALPTIDKVDKHEAYSAFRYCCEAMVSELTVEVSELKQLMSGFGDSLIVAGGKTRLRLHIHTNTPEAMFSQLAQFGQLSQIKADDMHLQMEAVQSPKRKMAIVTDSIADLPDDYALTNQVFVIPLQVEIEGVSHLDRISMTTKRFYEINPHLKEQPLSSMPSVKSVESLFQFLSEHYESILVLTVSDKLSGTYDLLASVAAQQRLRGSRIEVVNTLKNSGAQGLLVLESVALAERNLTVEDIAERIKPLRARTKILVAVDTVKYLTRSGRVSHQTGRLAKWLRLKPIMTLDANGSGKAYSAAVSHEAVLRKIEKAVLADHKQHGIIRYNVVHADCAETAEKWAKRLESLLGLPVAYISEISPVVGATAGEGAIAISYMLKDG